MTSIAIKPAPSRMANPDADMRYQIPQRIEQATANAVIDDGFEYLDDDKMVIFLRTSSPDDDTVIDILSEESFCENMILETGVVGVDSGSGYTVIHPQNYTGDFEVE